MAEDRTKEVKNPFLHSGKITLLKRSNFDAPIFDAASKTFLSTL